MSRYKVLTIPSCSRCKVIKSLVQQNNLDKEFIFVDLSSKDGQELVQKYNLMSAGIIVDTKLNKVIEFSEILKN